jgi:CMP-N,N'-diacetyllegionaminic acid synthase
MQNILLTIGARGGSKGFRSKNIRDLAGRPLICYTIEQALKWGKAKHVIVSTDLDKIAYVSKKCGAEVPFMRPDMLATDTAAKLPAIRHAVLESERIFGEKYEIIVDLDATAPIRTIEDLDNCLRIFINDRPDTLYSVVYAHKNPYFNMVEENDDGNYALSKKLGKTIVRRQDAPKVYSLNASIYFYNRDYLLNEKNNTCLTDNSKIYIMDDIAGIDIDREIDFKFIEFLINEGLVQL